MNMKEKIIEIFSKLSECDVDELNDRLDDHYFIEGNWIILSNDTHFEIKNVAEIEEHYDIRVEFVRDGHGFIIKIFGNMYGQECPCCGAEINEIGDCSTGCA